MRHHSSPEACSSLYLSQQLGTNHLFVHSPPQPQPRVGWGRARKGNPHSTAHRRPLRPPPSRRPDAALIGRSFSRVTQRRATIGRSGPEGRAGRAVTVATAAIPGNGRAAGELPGRPGGRPVRARARALVPPPRPAPPRPAPPAGCRPLKEPASGMAAPGGPDGAVVAAAVAAVP